MATARELPGGREGQALVRAAPKRRARFILPLLVILAILWMEGALRIRADAPFFNIGLLYVALFAGVAALLIFLAASFFRQVGRHVVVGLCLAALTIIFLSQFLYYDIFKTYSTVFSAANGGHGVP